MTHEPTDPSPVAESGKTDEDATRQLLGRALGSAPRLERSLLPSVQARIRRETHGRYFNPSRRRRFRDPTLLLLGSAMLLLALAAAFLALFETLFR